MNCKPGENAFIVKAGPLSQHLIGRVITVHTLVAAQSIPSWTYSPLLLQADGQLIQFAEDFCLCPIRDPGDDAVDESRLWFRIPEVDTV